MPHPIIEETVVDAPRSKVFAAFTTVEGVTGFLAPRACIELCAGGRYELAFHAGGEEGLRGTEGCRVQSWVEGEMLSLTWNAPPQFETVRCARTFVVLQFLDASGGGTLVRVTHGGWGEGDEWAEVRDYFANAWLRVLEHLGEYFIRGPRWPREETQAIVPAPHAKFAYFIRPARPEYFATPTPEEDEAVEAHAAYVRRLLARDRLEVAFRNFDPGIAPVDGEALDVAAPGIVLFRAVDEDEARRVMEDDPAVRAGVFQARLFRARIPFWRP